MIYGNNKHNILVYVPDFHWLWSWCNSVRLLNLCNLWWFCLVPLRNFINVSFLVTWGFICLLFIYFLIALGIEPRTLHVLGKCSITNLHLTHKWGFSNLQQFIPLNSDENLFSISHSVLHWKTKRNKIISLYPYSRILGKI